MTSSAVQVFAFEEPEVGRVLSALTAQAAGAPGDVTVEAWVTRSEDESGYCSTWESASSVGGVDVYEAPLGKLSARNAAHERAIQRGCDAIASWDADAPPVSDSAVSALLSAALRPGVALANSQPVASDGSLLGSIVDAGGRLEDTVRPHAHGQAHAFPVETWAAAGPFDVSIDQTNPQSVRTEEEFRFYNRARELGEVVTPGGAEVFNDPRRHYCYLPGMESNDYCVNIGEDTF